MAYAKVQTATAQLTVAHGTSTVFLGSASTPGNLLVGVAIASPGGGVTTVTTPTGFTALYTHFGFSPTPGDIHIFTKISAGETSVDWTATAGGSMVCQFFVTEYSGNPALLARDGDGLGNASTSDATTTGLMTYESDAAASDELVLLVSTSTNAIAATPPAGWNADWAPSTDDYHTIIDWQDSTAGTAPSGTFTWTQEGGWNAAMAIIGGAPGDTVTGTAAVSVPAVTVAASGGIPAATVTGTAAVSLPGTTIDAGGAFDDGGTWPSSTLPETTVEIAFCPPYGITNILSETDSNFDGVGNGTWTSTTPLVMGGGGFSGYMVFDPPTATTAMTATTGIYRAAPGISYTIMADFQVVTGGTVPLEFSIRVEWLVAGEWTTATGPTSTIITTLNTPVTTHGTVVSPAGTIAARLVAQVGAYTAAAGAWYGVGYIALIDAVTDTWIKGGTEPAIPAWTDISDYVRQLDTTAGTQHELAQVEASTAKIVLDNRDGRFNPWNTAGPYAPATTTTGLTPQMPIRVTATIPAGVPGAGTTYPVFYGYIDSWIPKWSNPMSPDLTIGATDMLGLLAAADFNSNAYQQQVAFDGAASLYRLNDPGPLYAVDQLGLNPPGTYLEGTGFGTTGPFITDANTAVTMPGLATIPLSAGMPNLGPVGDFTVEIWIQFPTVPTTSEMIYVNGINNFYVAYAAGTPGHISAGPYNGTINGTTGDITYQGIVDDGNWHLITLVYQAAGTFTGISIDGDELLGATVAIANVLDPWTLGNDTVGAYPMSGNLANFAQYPRALTQDEITAHYNTGNLGGAVEPTGTRISEILAVGGVPPALQDLATGISEIQPVSAVGLVAVSPNLPPPLPGGSNLTGSAASLVGTKLLDYLQQVNTTENGLIFVTQAGVFTFFDRHHTLTSAGPVATYEDSASSSFFYQQDSFVPGDDNLDLWNEIIASAQAYAPLLVIGGNQVVEYPGSQLQYGKRTYPSASGLLVTSDAEALAFAQYIGLRYSQPLPRIQSIRFDSTTNYGGNLTEMLDRQLWDKVLVIYNGMVGGTPLSQVQLIEGIEHSVTPDEWVTTFRLAPADPNAYFILDDPVQGVLAGTGSTAANVVAY